ncbi:MAG TPA: hypothetical protein VGE97_00755 [Nitrososphaera sp.]|jgi:hypothetical protein
MNLKLVKYVVVAQLIEMDDDENIVAERQTEPQSCYGKEQLELWVASIDGMILRERDDGLVGEAVSDGS